MRKQDKIKNLCIANLTYCRLKADLAAVEMEIAGNQPVAQENDSNIFKKAWNRLKTEVKNELRKKTVEELEKDRALAEGELARFEGEYTVKELQLSQNPAKFKAFMGKKLFKKDGYGLKKTQFALALILDNRYAYQRPEQSLCILSDILFDDGAYMQGLYDALCENFKYIRNDLSISLDELLSLAPSLGNVSLQSLINRHKQRKFKARLDKLSADQVGAVIAAKLTLTEKAKALLPQEKWETLADETLKVIGDIRADAEYEMVFGLREEGIAAEVFSLCSLAVERLAEIANT